MNTLSALPKKPPTSQATLGSEASDQTENPHKSPENQNEKDMPCCA